MIKVVLNMLKRLHFLWIFILSVHAVTAQDLVDCNNYQCRKHFLQYLDVLEISIYQFPYFLENLEHKFV